MGHYSKNLGPLADEVVTECEFVSLDQKRRVKAVRTMWDTGSNATILSTALVSELRPDLFGQGGMKGISDDSLRYNVDLAPTIADLFGLEKPKLWDGESYAEACDPAELGRVYTEGDPLPPEEIAAQAEEVLNILMGVSE